MKYYVIWEYHDTNVEIFDTLEDVKKYINHLKDVYKYDNDFSYTLICGVVMDV